MRRVVIISALVMLVLACGLVAVAAVLLTRPGGPVARLLASPTPSPTATSTLTPTPTFTPTPRPTPTPVVRDIIDEGDRLLLKNEVTEAEQRYRQALTLEPDNPRAHARLSFLASLFPDRRDEALAEAQKATDLAPDDGEMRAYLAWAMLPFYRYGDADEEIRKALEQAPDSAWVHVVASEVARARGEYDRALETARKAVAFNPDDPMAHHALGMAYDATAQYDLAEEELRRADSNWPPFALISMDLGALNLDLGRYDQAAAYFQRVLDAWPDYSPALALLGYAQYSLGKATRAQDLAQQAISVSTVDTTPHFVLTLISLDEQDYEQAQTYLEQARKRDPDALSLKIQEALIELRQEHCAQVLKIVEPLTNTPNPFRDTAYALVGEALLCQKSPSQAIRRLEEGKKLEPYSAQLRLTLGRAYAEWGNTDKAIEELEIASEYAPREATVWLQLALLYTDAGRCDDARRALRELNSLGERAQLMGAAIEELVTACGSELAAAPEGWSWYNRYGFAVLLPEHTIQTTSGLAGGDATEMGGMVLALPTDPSVSYTTFVLWVQIRKEAWFPEEAVTTFTQGMLKRSGEKATWTFGEVRQETIGELKVALQDLTGEVEGEKLSGLASSFWCNGRGFVLAGLGVESAESVQKRVRLQLENFHCQPSIVPEPTPTLEGQG